MRHLLLLISICALMTACAGGDLLVQRQTAMEGRIEQMMQSHTVTMGQVAELQRQVKELQDQAGKYSALEKSGEPERQALRERLALVSKRVDRLEAELPASQPTRIELVNREPGAQSRDELAQASYMKAFGLFSANNYHAAADAFDAFVASYPDSEYAPNARYWLGECYFSEGRFRQAIEAFSKVISVTPPAKRAPDALLRTGLSWYSLNEPDSGRTALRTLIEKYPDSEAAGKAREHLDKQ